MTHPKKMKSTLKSQADFSGKWHEVIREWSEYWFRAFMRNSSTSRTSLKISSQIFGDPRRWEALRKMTELRPSLSFSGLRIGRGREMERCRSALICFARSWTLVPFCRRMLTYSDNTSLSFPPPPPPRQRFCFFSPLNLLLSRPPHSAKVAAGKIRGKLILRGPVAAWTF